MLQVQSLTAVTILQGADGGVGVLGGDQVRRGWLRRARAVVCVARLSARLG